MGRRQKRQQQDYYRKVRAPAETLPARQCARGEHCKDRTVKVDAKTGDRTIIPGSSHQAFCVADTTDIAAKLRGLTLAHKLLILERHEPAPPDNAARHGNTVSPPLLIRGDVDAALRRNTTVLCYWQDRIIRLRGLTLADPARLGRYDTPEPVAAAVKLLTVNLAAVLALQADDGAGRPHAWPGELDGARAGLEILALAHTSELVIGAVARKPELLLGIDCYRCVPARRTLRRADPPQSELEPLWYSECMVCGHRMTEPDYREHVSRLWAMVRGRERLDA